MSYVYQEYPRMLHRAGGDTRIVANDTERDDAIEAGWSLTPVVESEVVEQTEAAQTEGGDVKKPAKRGRKPRTQAAQTEGDDTSESSEGYDE